MSTYKTFKRSCVNWEQFARARKMTVDTGLTEEEAWRRCKEFNESRTAAQIRKGTKLEYTKE